MTWIVGAAQGLPASEVIAAELLKTAGCRTGIIDQWHLGQLPRCLPAMAASHRCTIEPAAPLFDALLPFSPGRE